VIKPIIDNVFVQDSPLIETLEKYIDESDIDSFILKLWNNEITLFDYNVLRKTETDDMIYKCIEADFNSEKFKIDFCYRKTHPKKDAFEDRYIHTKDIWFFIPNRIKTKNNLYVSQCVDDSEDYDAILPYFMRPSSKDYIKILEDFKRTPSKYDFY